MLGGSRGVGQWCFFLNNCMRRLVGRLWFEVENVSGLYCRERCVQRFVGSFCFVPIVACVSQTSSVFSCWLVCLLLSGAVGGAVTGGCRQGRAVVRSGPKILGSTSLSLCSLSSVVSLDDCSSSRVLTRCYLHGGFPWGCPRGLWAHLWGCACFCCWRCFLQMAMLDPDWPADVLVSVLLEGADARPVRFYRWIERELLRMREDAIARCVRPVVKDIERESLMR